MDSKQVTDLAKMMATLEENQRCLTERIENLEAFKYVAQPCTEFDRIWKTLDGLRADIDALDTNRPKPVSFCGPLDPDGHVVRGPRPCGCEESLALKGERDLAQSELTDLRGFYASVLDLIERKGK